MVWDRETLIEGNQKRGKNLPPPPRSIKFTHPKMCFGDFRLQSGAPKTITWLFLVGAQYVHFIRLTV